MLVSSDYGKENYDLLLGRMYQTDTELDVRIFYSSFCTALFCFLTHLSTCSADTSDLYFLPLAMVAEEDLPAWLAVSNAITLRISAGSLYTEHGISLKLPPCSLPPSGLLLHAVWAVISSISFLPICLMFFII